jgi:sarcosine oxidase delta subunit
MNNDCTQGRKRFTAEWEAYAFMRDNPKEEPAPEQYVHHCQDCHGFHISEYPQRKGRKNGKQKRQRRR